MQNVNLNTSTINLHKYAFCEPHNIVSIIFNIIVQRFINYTLYIYKILLTKLTCSCEVEITLGARTYSISKSTTATHEI